MSVDVSVIVTTYNVERYVERAIMSALSQEGVSLEVILVDDASADGTWAEAEKISDPRLNRIRMERNGGPSAARNAGIAAARGTWIAVLDGDDAFEPGRLARCLALADGADIIVDNLTVLREADGARFPMFALAFSTLGLEAFIRGNASFLGGYTLGYLKPLFSAAFLKRHGLSYDATIRIGEDYLLMAEALAAGAVCRAEKTAGYIYTVRAGSISHRLTAAHVARISECDKKFLSRHALSPAAMKAQKKRECALKEAYAFTLLVEAIKGGDVIGAVKAVAGCPSAALHLWRPLRARIWRAA